MDPRSKKNFFSKKLTSHLHCYLDETGNTGLNHFDENQSHFMLGCAVTSANLDKNSLKDFSEIHKIINTNEIHANELGSRKLSEIDKHLIDIITKNNVRFIFIDIEKLHHISMMMFHHFYDPGINPAATNPNLVFKIQRLTLAYNFSLFVELQDKKDFWTSVKNKDISIYVESLKRIKARIKVSFIDYRSQELICDVLAYTIQNPKEIFESMNFNEMISPNIASLSILLNGLQTMFLNQNVRIEKFIHDEQKQFGRFLAKQYSIGSRFYLPQGATDSMFDFREKKLLQNTALEFSDSKSSLGLQLIDSALWIYKRYHYGKTDHELSLLIEFIKNRTAILGITYKMHIEELQLLQEDLYSRDINLTSKNIKKGMELMKECENRRWKEV